MELLPREAPMTVESFVALARKGFFDGTTIHRVVPDFVVQAGDPRGDGTGGPDYALRDELNPLPYDRGTDRDGSERSRYGRLPVVRDALAASRTSTAATRFSASVTSGMDVVDRIEQNDRLVS